MQENQTAVACNLKKGQKENEAAHNGYGKTKVSPLCKSKINLDV